MPAADIIISNAKILTMDADSPRAEALAIAGNRLLAVGRPADIAGFKAKHTRVIDASGMTVLPGFIESGKGDGDPFLCQRRTGARHNDGGRNIGKPVHLHR